MNSTKILVLCGLALVLCLASVVVLKHRAKPAITDEAGGPHLL